MFLTGKLIGNGQFSRDMVGTMVSEWVYTASILSERRWNHILDLCGAQVMEQRATSLKELSAPFNRRTLYEPSSPTKVSDSE
jgi:hypothetical protein